MQSGLCIKRLGKDVQSSGNGFGAYLSPRPRECMELACHRIPRGAAEPDRPYRFARLLSPGTCDSGDRYRDITSEYPAGTDRHLLCALVRNRADAGRVEYGG